MTFINIEIPFLPAKNYKNKSFFLKSVVFLFISVGKLMAHEHCLSILHIK